MLQKVGALVCVALILSSALPTAAAKHDKRRQPEPCPPPPPCATKPAADKNYEVRITSIEAGAAALPVIETVLASTSNREDQRRQLETQSKAGVPILSIAYGPTVRVPQDETRTSVAPPNDVASPNDQDVALPTTPRRVTAHPHLNAACAEAVDISVEQTAGTRSVLPVASACVFENGDTKLLGRALRPDGTWHLVYATVFFPSCEPLVLVCR